LVGWFFSGVRLNSPHFALLSFVLSTQRALANKKCNQVRVVLCQCLLEAIFKLFWTRQAAKQAAVLAEVQKNIGEKAKALEANVLKVGLCCSKEDRS
jgi:hypothetical protein